MVNVDKLNSLSCNLVSNPDNPMNSFRRNVSMYISQKDITLQEVAELADIPTSTLKSLLYGNAKDCSLSIAIKLARVFHVSVDELVGADTTPVKTCKSLQTLRMLPKSFTNFIRWIIQFRYKNQDYSIPQGTSIEVMIPSISPEGNLKITNQFIPMTINSLSGDSKPKIFMGIRIPDNIFEPVYFKGNVLLLASDRRPRNGEHVIYSTNDNLWLSEYRTDGLYSIINGMRLSDIPEDRILGYVAKIIDT